MFYSFFILPFLIIFQHFLIPFSNANPSNDDKMLIAFMKGDPNIQISEYSKQKYEAHLGILYYMRMNWHCEKIADGFEEFERTECQKYRKYLDILYEYLCREYVGIPTVKPKFVFKEQIEINGPIIYAVNCLVKISQFYFIERTGQFYEYKLNKLFNSYFEPKLLNEERLNFVNEKQMLINEMILQLAIETANNYNTNESLDGIIQQKFDKNLQEMFKKAEKWAKEDDESIANKLKEDKHLIIISTKFDESSNWVDDCLFSEFVKGLATNFTNFSKLTKEYSSNVKEDLVLECEVYLSTLYLMRKNWHCDKIGKEFEGRKRTKCQKYRNYLFILYEYLFGLYVEAKSPDIKKQLSSLVKPKFFFVQKFIIILIDVVQLMNEISKYFWKKGENECEDFKNYLRINLANEKEMNYEINEEKIEENGKETMIKRKRQKTKTFNDSVEIDNLRREFEGKMEKICEKTKENAKKLEGEYDDIFDAFDSSPFS